MSEWKEKHHLPVKYSQDWQTVRLSEIAKKIGSGATPLGGSASYLPARTKFALVRSQNVFDRCFNVSGLAFISDEQASRLRNVFLEENDLLLNITGDGITFARSCKIPKEILPACVNQHVAIIRINPDIADSDYILSYLTHPDLKAYIESFNAGGSRRAITKGDIESFIIPLPPLPEQKAIARILSALDDKIELNRRMNETLEAMARAIFKDWFVDFGPTRAKMSGRATYLPEHLWSLFPGAIDPETGLPMGWDITPFESIVSVKDGTHDSPKMCDFGYPLITSKHLKNGFIDFENSYLISERDFFDVNKRSKVDRFDILITMIGTVGNLFFVDYQSINFAIKNIGLFKTSEKPHLAEYLYLYLGSSNITNYLKSRQSGTTQAYLTLKTLRTLPVVLPKVELVEAFKAKIGSIFERITVNRDESRTLADLRDRLLPKLMSGEIRVKEAEKLLEDAV